MEELAAANSLIRPGTGGLDQYVEGKQHPETIRQIDERLAKPLRPTYGAIIFQEQIMSEISELMGIPFGEADIYRRALEKMHKPENKKKVDYFKDNCVEMAVKRGIPKEDAEYIKNLILDNCGYAFNKCLSGREKIYGKDLTIEEMYNNKNTEYGYTLSMNDEGKLYENKIVDIRYSGMKSVYKITTEDGSSAECTINHSFPTPNGKKLLIDLRVGDELYTREKDLDTKTSKIVSIEFIDNEKVYDVEMKAPHHNLLLSNGIVCGNSHAVCYSYISYFTAYMKVHYPTVFHKTMLNSNLGDFGSFYDMATEEGMDILPPHINHSKFITEIEDIETNKLRVGFNIVNGIGAVPAAGIHKNAPYNNINEYFEKNETKNCNKKTTDAVLSCGGFEGLGVKVDTECLNMDIVRDLGFEVQNDDTIILNRFQAEKWYHLYLDYAKQKTAIFYNVPFKDIKNKFVEKYEIVKEKDETAVIPEKLLKELGFDPEKDQLPKSRKKCKGLLKELSETIFKPADAFTRPFVENLKELAGITANVLEVYATEKEKNGFSFVKHPLHSFANRIEKVKETEDGAEMFIAGVIIKMEEVISKKGRLYYKLYIQTPHEVVSCNLWAAVYKRYKDIIKQYGLVKIKGTKGYGGMTIDVMAPINSIK